MNYPRCVRCEMCIDLNFDEAGEWCSTEHCPDGEFEKTCGYCGKKNLIIVNWSPKFEAEEIEGDYD